MAAEPKFLSRVFACNHCSKLFSCRSSLARHRKQVHKIIPQPCVGSQVLKCAEASCIFETNRKDALRDHLTSQHDIAMRTVDETFESCQQFRNWLDLISVAEKCKLSQVGCRIEQSHRTVSYHCSRSGRSRVKNAHERKRKMRSKGSCKTGTACTAYLNVRENIRSGRVKVTGCLTHYGHATDIQHLSISRSDREAILEEVRKGYPTSLILRNVRGNRSKSSEGPERSHLITAQDVRNVAEAENSGLWKLHSDEWLSLERMVGKLAEENYNPVLSYGFREAGGKDFFVVLQTEFQMQTLIANAGNLVYVARGMPAKKLKLIAVSVADENGRAVSTAWCLSNRTGAETLVEFFGAIRKRVGGLSPKFFVSDDADEYYAAWTRVFGENGPPRKLLCERHVEAAWAKELPKRCGNDVLGDLENILREKDIETHRAMLKEMLNRLRADERTAGFAERFEKTYSNRSEQWARAFRTSLLEEVNLESFHGSLDNFLSKGRVKRVDKLVFALLTTSKGYSPPKKTSETAIAEQIDKTRSTSSSERAVSAADLTRLVESARKVNGLNEELMRLVASPRVRLPEEFTELQSTLDRTAELAAEACGRLSKPTTPGYTDHDYTPSNRTFVAQTETPERNRQNNVELDATWQS